MKVNFSSIQEAARRLGNKPTSRSPERPPSPWEWALAAFWCVTLGFYNLVKLQFDIAYGLLDGLSPGRRM